MKIAKSIARTCSLAGIVAAATMAPVQSAHAGIPVIDAGNLMQNIMSAIQTLQSNVNEAMQLANQAQQIAHEVQNLQQLPNALASSLVGQYTSQWNQLRSTFNGTSGIATNPGSVVTSFNTAFPDRATGGPLTPTDMLSQTGAWLQQTRRTLQGVYQQSGQVMQDVPTVQAQIQSILSQSQASNGALDATQAATQMNGAVASQMIQLNAQMATMFQAQTDMMAQEQQRIDNARRVSIDARTTWGMPSTQPAAAYLPTLH